LKTVILPKRNADDLDDVPAEVKDAMKFIYAETVDDVLKSALESVVSDGKKKTTTKKAKTNGKSNARRR
jgi:ATP-dependent Lon protease